MKKQVGGGLENALEVFHSLASQKYFILMGKISTHKYKKH